MGFVAVVSEPLIAVEGQVMGKGRISLRFYRQRVYVPAVRRMGTAGPPSSESAILRGRILR